MPAPEVRFDTAFFVVVCLLQTQLLIDKTISKFSAKGFLGKLARDSRKQNLSQPSSFEKNKAMRALLGHLRRVDGQFKVQRVKKMYAFFLRRRREEKAQLLIT